MAFRATRALLTTLPKLSHPQATPTPLKKTPATKKKTTILEVERKFRRLAVPSLTTTVTTNIKNRYSPAFQSIQPLPTRTIHDIYYDTPHRTLCAAGAWIRRRNGAWEAKLKRGGDFVNSRFEELRGAEEIGACVRAILGDIPVSGAGGSSSPSAFEERDNFGLGTLAEFVTTREAWVVDGEFRVVRDVMDFGHEVGEVELQVEVEEGTMGEGEKGVMMEEMDQKVEGFMKRYKWAWEKGEAVGKLTAYFEMVKRRG
ncbi:CYTH-like domain-containing protein [Parachaetomium inaequale]|uniref:CYTH-like domain-containing protein n=1 Tax=Parachaetomium inaequale TaxID=2588326 RepID=A0AAN6P951_9PEZI|nr:CYTH-like domain-containing protein [Parachaetomium inaequale]